MIAAEKSPITLCTPARPHEPLKRKKTALAMGRPHQFQFSEDYAAFAAGRYPDCPAFFMASSASSTESNGVVCTALHAPPHAIAIAMPAAVTLSGISVIRNTS